LILSVFFLRVIPSTGSLFLGWGRKGREKENFLHINPDSADIERGEIPP